MKFLVCVDDTDDLTKSTSTGTVSELIGKEVTALGGVLEHGISRHQLLLHEDIRYTSHNSSMCFVAEIQPEKDGEEASLLEAVWQAGVRVIEKEKAEAADPGLCLCRLDGLTDPDRLIAFGRRAQKEVLTKEEAYETARAVGGVRLEELGGTGIGVIGALAGIGLRLWGNDGTFRGRAGVGEFNVTLPAEEMRKKLGVSRIIDLNGSFLEGDEPVYIEKFAKLVYLDHKVMAVVRQREDGIFVICKKADLYDGDRKTGNWVTQCELFAPDNDYEERYGEEDAGQEEKSCYNCLYRRWNAEGFSCMAADGCRKRSREG